MPVPSAEVVFFAAKTFEIIEGLLESMGVQKDEASIDDDLILVF